MNCCSEERWSNPIWTGAHKRPHMLLTLIFQYWGLINSSGRLFWKVESIHLGAFAHLLSWDHSRLDRNIANTLTYWYPRTFGMICTFKLCVIFLPLLFPWGIVSTLLAHVVTGGLITKTNNGWLQWMGSYADCRDQGSTGQQKVKRVINVL